MRLHRLLTAVAVVRGVLSFAVAAAVFAISAEGTSAADRPELTMVVMDPLAAPLACACVQGYAQRRYERLAEYLEQELGCKVRIAFGEDLQSTVRQKTGGKVELVIGKDSMVRFDANQLKRAVRPVAALTGKDGSTTQHGLFVVPAEDPAQTLSDLKGYTILFGPFEADEKHAAALAALAKAGVKLPSGDELKTREACSEGACDILDKDFEGAGAAVISSYAKPLLEGCGTIDKGALRIVGRTGEVPFVTAFVTDSVDDETAQRIQSALLGVGKNAELCVALETLKGFVAYPDEKKKN
jgi:ABC-type phosphate/phosphonate transport system substrate-binding protein